MPSCHLRQPWPVRRHRMTEITTAITPIPMPIVQPSRPPRKTRTEWEAESCILEPSKNRNGKKIPIRPAPKSLTSSILHRLLKTITNSNTSKSLQRHLQKMTPTPWNITYPTVALSNTNGPENGDTTPTVDGRRKSAKVRTPPNGTARDTTEKNTSNRSPSICERRDIWKPWAVEPFLIIWTRTSRSMPRLPNRRPLGTCSVGSSIRRSPL
mmetsp:Transcript_4806/g.8922  ORF Transcript_4806/g.8922 Transcript_4806/m.8922 type:complete len:211 (-) Transcript_4806:296-928(-)